MDMLVELRILKPKIIHSLDYCRVLIHTHLVSSKFYMLEKSNIMQTHIFFECMKRF